MEWPSWASSPQTSYSVSHYSWDFTGGVLISTHQFARNTGFCLDQAQPTPEIKCSQLCALSLGPRLLLDAGCVAAARGCFQRNLELTSDATYNTTVMNHSLL